MLLVKGSEPSSSYFDPVCTYVKVTPILRNKECFPNVKQVFLLYLVGSLVTLIAY